MHIQVITTFFKEEFLLPLLTLHYDYSDEITLITSRRDDHLFDDDDKQRWVNDAVRSSRADWVILVDCDEFLWPAPYGTNPRAVLEKEQGSLIYSRMVRVWRHKTDADIDRTRHPVPQRLHGIAELRDDGGHIKPCVFRPNPTIRLGIGNHDIHSDKPLPVGKEWSGAHWANADACFWVERETRDRGPRLTQRNKERGYGTHTLRSKEQILAECKAHENDPQIIVL
jgi:hypothetical protein